MCIFGVRDFGAMGVCFGITRCQTNWHSVQWDMLLTNGASKFQAVRTTAWQRWLLAAASYLAYIHVLLWLLARKSILKMSNFSLKGNEMLQRINLKVILKTSIISRSWKQSLRSLWQKRQPDMKLPDIQECNQTHSSPTFQRICLRIPRQAGHSQSFSCQLQATAQTAAMN